MPPWELHGGGSEKLHGKCGMCAYVSIFQDVVEGACGSPDVKKTGVVLSILRVPHDELLCLGHVPVLLSIQVVLAWTKRKLKSWGPSLMSVFFP